MARFANIIIDISAEAVDRPFTYRIPEALSASVFPGVRVEVPFGNAKKPKTGYVTELTDNPGFEESRIREILSISPGAIEAEGEMITLASFLAEEYGSTMAQALRAVLPVKREVRRNSRRTDPAEQLARLYKPLGETFQRPALTEAQAGIVEDLCTRYEAFRRAVGAVPEEARTKAPFASAEGAAPRPFAGFRPSLLYGITGSGKTLVYISLIEYMQRLGKKSIVLIPEISLTYQTVGALSRYFGDRVSVLHSRLSLGERYEQYEKARTGEIDVMVGPRSALFAPFSDLGLIIIDEEHERAYHSDTSPRYDAREAAIRMAELSGSMLLLGSATPSLLSYQRALSGQYALYRLTERAAKGAALPNVRLCDMRAELQAGNRSIFSRELSGLMEDRLQKGQQTILFLNRRGYAGFVSCRSCGYVVKCPHCDVSLTAHNDWYYDRQSGKRESALLRCHYCGYEAPMPALCPSCKSRYIAPFGTGTQKVEAELKRSFPKARVLRMDADSTARKGAHERILAAFQRREADILLGTQMIVKGHDFPDVTLVGVLAADLSLYAAEYDAAERTFQLLIQASGRAGRGTLSGDVVIQTYDPSHYAVSCAAKQDYEAFYAREMSYRKLLSYPPAVRLLSVRFQAGDEALLSEAIEAAKKALLQKAPAPGKEGAAPVVIGPCKAGLYKVNDTYRKILYIKHESHDIIIRMRNILQEFMYQSPYGREVQLAFDLD